MAYKLFLMGFLLMGAQLMADDSLRQGRSLVRQGAKDSALPYYILYLENNAGSAQYHLALIEATWTLGTVSAQITFLHRFLSQLTSALARQEIFTLLGQLYELKNDFKNAVFCYVQAWQAGRPPLPALALQAAMMQLELGEHQRAISLVNTIFNHTLSEQQREQALMVYCVAWSAQDELARLNALLTAEAEFLAEDRSAGLLYVLHKYYAQHQPAQATVVLQRLKTQHPHSPEIKLIENTIRVVPTPAVLW